MQAAKHAGRVMKLERSDPFGAAGEKSRLVLDEEA